MMSHAGKLSDDCGCTDLQGVKLGENAAADDLLGGIVPLEIAFMVDYVFVRWWGTTGSDDEITPSKAEGVE
jgi:hypothetical protein